MNFNAAFQGAFPALLPLVNGLMRQLGWADVRVNNFTTQAPHALTACDGLISSQISSKPAPVKRNQLSI